MVFDRTCWKLDREGDRADKAYMCETRRADEHAAGSRLSGRTAHDDDDDDDAV